MLRFKKVFVFYKHCSLKNKLLIIKSVLDLPALLIHEFLHILVAILLGIKIIGIAFDYFYKVERGTLYSYSFHVKTSFNNDKFGLIREGLVNIAPLLSFVILPLISPYFIVWLVFSFKIFQLSDQDAINFKNNFNNFLNKKPCL